MIGHYEKVLIFYMSYRRIIKRNNRRKILSLAGVRSYEELEESLKEMDKKYKGNKE